MIRTTINSVKVSQITSLYMVTLCEQQGKRSLHIFVESDEATAIADALDNKLAGDLGWTYDLVCLLIRGFSGRVSMIVVSDCKRSKGEASLSFNAKMLVTDGVKEFTIVCHAPDALAIASLTQAPIFVEESVMDMSNSDALTQARVDELSWNPVKLKSEELPREMNRMLSSEEVNIIGAEVELVVDEVRHAMLDYFHVVVLTEKQQKWYVPVMTNTTHAHTIENLIHKTALPNSHHLLCKIVEGFSSVVSMAIISPLKNPEAKLILGQKAKLIFATGDRRFGVECNFSDAVITALIAKAPIYAMKSELNTEGISRVEAQRLTQGLGLI